jgi:hypothetical protein
MTPDRDPIDDLVRDHLDREAARVDSGRILARVKGRSSAVPSRRTWLRIAAGVGGGAAIAAGVGLFYFGQSPPVAETRAATAEELVREAKAVHATPADRGYDVTAEWEPALFTRLNLQPIVRKSRLWTRGDQFWIESTAPDGHTIAWGQDAASRVWVAPGRKRGLVFDASEVGEPVAKYCDLMSLRVVSTLAQVLEQFEMLRKDAGQPGEPIRIEATIRPTFLNRNPRFREIALTLDPETKVIRQAVLKRQANGEAVGTLTFTLADSTPQPDERYSLRGHLDADAEVLDKKDGPKSDRRTRFRDEALKRLQSRFK